MKIWLDDLRPAPAGFVWCRSVNEAKRLIAEQETSQPIECIDCDTTSATMPTTEGTGSDFWIGFWSAVLCIPSHCIR